MEEELLQGMIRDRETQIKLIVTKVEEQKKKLERTQYQRAEVEQLLQSQKVQHRQELEGIIKQLKTVQRDYRVSTDSLDMKKQQQQQSLGGGSAMKSSGSAPTVPNLHVYHDIMKSVATPESNDSSYVLRMQSQLCKSMHSMGMLENQLQLASYQQEQVTKSLKDVITNMVEEKSQLELKLMNELVVADNLRRDVEAKCKAQAESFSKEKDDLMDKIERQNEQSKEEEPEVEDEEEKEELKEILTQGREEIERLQLENKEQEEILEELKQLVALAKGQDIVEEIVSSIAEEFKEAEEENNGEDSED
jgi:hypothetical protein